MQWINPGDALGSPVYNYDLAWRHSDEIRV